MNLRRTTSRLALLGRSAPILKAAIGRPRIQHMVIENEGAVVSHRSAAAKQAANRGILGEGSRLSNCAAATGRCVIKFPKLCPWLCFAPSVTLGVVGLTTKAQRLPLS